jgi:hypothetical protein
MGQCISVKHKKKFAISTAKTSVEQRQKSTKVTGKNSLDEIVQNSMVRIMNDFYPEEILTPDQLIQNGMMNVAKYFLENEVYPNLKQGKLNGSTNKYDIIAASTSEYTSFIKKNIWKSYCKYKLEFHSIMNTIYWNVERVQ